MNQYNFIPGMVLRCKREKQLYLGIKFPVGKFLKLKFLSVAINSNGSKWGEAVSVPRAAQVECCIECLHGQPTRCDSASVDKV